MAVLLSVASNSYLDELKDLSANCLYDIIPLWDGIMIWVGVLGEASCSSSVCRQ